MYHHDLRSVCKHVLTLALCLTSVISWSQLHDVLIEPSNALYSSTCEISDGSEDMLVASTIDDESPENQVRITRVHPDGTLDWEWDYIRGGGWRGGSVLSYREGGKRDPVRLGWSSLDR